MTMTIAEKVKPFFFETNRLFFAERAETAVMLFRSVQLPYLILRNFYYHAMQQYRYSNFSHVFCLNCIFVIDAAVKQLVSRSFLKYIRCICSNCGSTQIKNQIFTVGLLVSLTRGSTEAWWRVVGAGPVA